MIRFSENPNVDTVAKLVAVAAFMFAFVFVVMVPLYNVLCDALGINGKGVWFIGQITWSSITRYPLFSPRKVVFDGSIITTIFKSI